MGLMETRARLAPGWTLAKRAGGALPKLALAAALAAGLALARPAQAMLSEQDVLIYQAAFEAADVGAWDAARQMVERARDPVLAKVIDWISASNDDGDAGFPAIAAFLRDNPDWPDQTGMRRRAEQVMPDSLPPADIAAWFDQWPPVTVEGLLRYGRALIALGRTVDADALAQAEWRTIGVNEAHEREFLAVFGPFLQPADHIARLDHLLWEGRDSEARRLYPLVGDGWRALAEARIQLANRASGVDPLVAAVPAALAGDEGLLYERLRWRRRSGLTDGAIDMLGSQPQRLTHPDRWWQERNIITRRLFNEGDIRRAYAVASGHGQSEGFPLAQAEWLAGWLALRFLDDPQRAVGHFQRLYENVGTPISLGRGAYWTGRAYDALGNRPEAEAWYRRGAAHSSSFYGQLAADRLGLPTVPALPPDPSASPEQLASFEDSELVRVARALDRIGENARADLFLRRLARLAEGPAETALVARLAAALDRPDMAVFAAKRLIFDGLTFYESGYPLLPLETADPRAEPALVLGLIRRESEFRTDAVSPAGARGLMQLMPGTAQGVSNALGVSHSTARLTAEPAHNIRLGSHYLAEMIGRFGGSYILATAAYNAGPGRVDDWLISRGDPRQMGTDAIIDWIESIPIYETRNYVQRVLEDAQVYRLRLGAAPQSGRLEADLAR
ncbi:MAG: transglycosylase SLT domain-containing protein [Alphaproteobacteria bacterium]|jgi:soluble lytic murein transglycosylase|nr:transglycosylase SLT domain-containing protein [Alphaproteobacteria bacterium]